ncbi:MarR family winged helix-turn-helix transcriptional regulator [Nocardiopsis baichengensis]|uniref:MarR family winged helix-turn-helix transcriptional regulator n=1 Tax=Nocardiopsis baichengensis TaxID=280240 RepID=UPI000348C53F|nr:MarR family transcriptional regulator [Nocardiopsis baichengensis]
MPEADERLYFLLQRAAHRLRTDADRRLLEAAGVTAAQLGALFAVRAEPGATQRRLAEVLGLRESAVTALVRRLAGAGLLVKGAHPDEHRAVVLELTEAGEEALRAARPEMARFTTELRARLGDEGFSGTAASLRLIAYGPEDD